MEGIERNFAKDISLLSTLREKGILQIIAGKGPLVIEDTQGGIYQLPNDSIKQTILIVENPLTTNIERVIF